MNRANSALSWPLKTGPLIKENESHRMGADDPKYCLKMPGARRYSYARSS
jgi:hypothetical protein